MNKFTKLLSIFVIAGAVGCGVGAVAGCKSDSGHTHSSVKHEKVDATCTVDGTEEYYTCSAAGCEGKYYEDKECTKEVKLEDLTIAKRGEHTYKYTDNGDGTHNKECEHGDLTAVKENHKDADSNKECDDCKAKLYTISKVDEVPATCTATGVKAHYVSDNPALKDVYYSDAEGKTEVTADSLVIPMLEHVDANDDKKCDVCQAYLTTLVAEVPATCHSEGTLAHYVSSDPALEGKLFSDAACTQEVTAESLVIEKLPHTVTQGTPNEDATHNGPCTAEGCGEIVKNIPCVDADGDDKCDVCGGDMAFLKNVLTPGSYINRDTKTEFILNDDGFSVSYTPDAYSSPKTGLIDLTVEGPTWTIEYEDGKTETVGFTRNGLKVGANYIETAPAEITATIDKFKGKFLGEIVLTSGDSIIKITEFNIYDEGDLRATMSQGVKGSDGTITYSDSYVFPVDYGSQLWHNAFTQYVNGLDITFTAIEGSATGVAKLEVSCGETKSVFTYESTPTEKVAALPTDNFTLYTNANAKLVNNYSYGNKLYTLTYAADMVDQGTITLLSGSEADGYLVYTSTYEGAPKNYILKMVTSSGAITAIDLCDGKGTVLETLALTEQEFPLLKEDGTANTGAVVDEFYPYNAYYKVGKTGWYTFESVNGANLYTDVIVTDTEHSVGWQPTAIPAGGSKTLYFEAGAYVAVSVYEEAEFTSTYSETEPVPEAIAITGSSYTISNFNSETVYTLKGTAATTGKYYVSIVDDGGYTDRGAYFEIDGTKYGYNYDFMSGWSVCGTGKVYEANLETGAEVTITVGCANQYFTLIHSVTVYFETEEQYNNRVGGGSTTPDDPDPVIPTEVFTADQQGTYVYEREVEGHKDTYKFTLEANTVTIEDAMGPYGLTYKSTEGETYTFADADGNNWTFSFDTDGNLVASDGVETYTAVKGGTSSGGETPAFTGFTAEQQGTYTYTYAGKNGDATVTIVIGVEDVHYTDSEKTTANGFALPFESLAGDVYTFKNSMLNMGVTFAFVDGNLYVSTDSINNKGPYTATRVAFAGFSETEQGEYTYTYQDRVEATITITLGATSTVNYVHSMYYEEGIELTVTEANGVYTCTSINGDVVFSINADGSLNVTTDTVSTATGGTYTATKGGTSTGGGEEISSNLKIGPNTVKAGSWDAYEYTFTGEAGKQYAFTYNESDMLVCSENNFGAKTYANGEAVTADANGQIKVYLFSNHMDSSYSPVECTTTLTVAEA